MSIVGLVISVVAVLFLLSRSIDKSNLIVWNI